MKILFTGATEMGGDFGHEKAARLLTVSHRVSNESFRRATGWRPSFPSADSGWAEIVKAN